jgi:hypothetical protein
MPTRRFSMSGNATYQACGLLLNLPATQEKFKTVLNCFATYSLVSGASGSHNSIGFPSGSWIRANRP